MGRYRLKLNIRRIELARAAKGWSIKELAVHAGLDYDIVRATVRGISQGPDTVKRICDALGIQTETVWA